MTLGSKMSLYVICAGVVGLAGCGSSSDGPVGGPVVGALDMHCGTTKQQIGQCLTGSAAADAAAADPDGGASSGGSIYGDTMYNAEGDDDDCKYHIAWTSTPIRRNADVTFNVTLTRLLDQTPSTGDDITIEAFLTDTHPTPSLDIKSTGGTDGKYSVGTVRFDAAGMWTVRFHFNELCSDLPEDSPHGHAAFFVNVP
jgi:hypothetical protein